MPESNGTKLITATSIRMVGALLGVLVAICMAIVGFNFAADADLHERVEHLKECKVDIKMYSDGYKRIEADMRELRKGQADGFKEMRDDAKEIRNLIMDLHQTKQRNGD